jgi:shikimate kinase
MSQRDRPGSGNLWVVPHKPGTVVLLAGPKAVGKSWVAEILRQELGVHEVDADAIVLDLMASGVKPHPTDGWLAWIEDAVTDSLQRFPLLSVEVTGAWASDFELARRLVTTGVMVRWVRVRAGLAESLHRLASRTSSKVPTSEDEARWLYEESARRLDQQWVDAVIDTTGHVPREAVVSALASTLASNQRGAEGT